MSKEIFRCVYGSQLFGTNTPESDEDFRSVILPTSDNVLLGKAKAIVQTESRERANVAGDVDKTALTVQAFLSLLSRSEVTAIETLFAPPLFSTPEWDLITQHQDSLVCSQVSKFIGFSKSQIMRYGGRGNDVAAAQAVLEALDGVKGNQSAVSASEDVMRALQALCDVTPTLKMNADPQHPSVILLSLNGRSAQLTQNVKDVRVVFQGFIDRAGKRSLDAAKREDKADLKGMYHAVRILYEAEELLNTGRLSFPLASAPLLLRIRSGEFSTEQCIEMCDEQILRVQAAERSTSLPKEINDDLVRQLIIDLHGDIVVQAHVDNGLSM